MAQPLSVDDFGSVIAADSLMKWRLSDRTFLKGPNTEQLPLKCERPFSPSSGLEFSVHGLSDIPLERILVASLLAQLALK